MKARIHKKLFVGLALAAALTAPAAVLRSRQTRVPAPPELSYIQGPGGNNDLGRWETFRRRARRRWTGVPERLSGRRGRRAGLGVGGWSARAQ